jgi:hypothetical protein
MLHPFEVGKTYRNRNGEYVVQALDGDWMKIRYASGGTLETRASLQARIWENIQFEEQVAREEERLRLAREARMAARKRTARAKRAPAEPQFSGFEKSDFEPKKRGIAWATRKELGKVLAHELSQRTKGDFDSWIVPRQEEVHAARKAYYDRETREISATFFVAADEKGVTYGFRVGKPNGRSKVKWHWRILMAALASGKQVHQALRTAMEAHELSLDVYAMEASSYGQVARVTVQDRGFLWQHETADQEVTQKMSGTKLAEYLQSLPATKRCDLYVRKRVPAKDAVQAKAAISARIAAALEALVPLYDVSVGAEKT